MWRHNGLFWPCCDRSLIWPLQKQAAGDAGDVENLPGHDYHSKCILAFLQTERSVKPPTVSSKSYTTSTDGCKDAGLGGFDEWKGRLERRAERQGTMYSCRETAVAEEWNDTDAAGKQSGSPWTLLQWLPLFLWVITSKKHTILEQTWANYGPGCVCGRSSFLILLAELREITIIQVNIICPYFINFITFQERAKHNGP